MNEYAHVNEANESNNAQAPLEIKKQYIYADKVADFATKLSALISDCDAHNIPVTPNFESGEFPDGRDLAVIPLKTKAKKGVPARIREVLLIAVHTLEQVLNDTKLHAEGTDFVRKAVAAKLCSKAVSAAGKDDSILPTALADFILTQRGGGGIMSGYNDIASNFVRYLRELGFPDTLDKPMLKECLSNASAAQQWFSSIDQSGWLAIIDKMQAYAADQDLPTDIYDTWRATRDSQTFAITNDDILSAISNLQVSKG